MPLQNRVDPAGEIHAVPMRGLFTGNRGIIHDPRTKRLLGRRWSTTAWIICLCEFKGRRREVMATRSWTELFFLDEVTALAAGHRPCHRCRGADARRFADCLARSLGRGRMSAREIDLVLHAERLAGGARPLPIEPSKLASLPDGTIIRTGKRYYALHDERAWPWAFSGYGRPVERASLAVEAIGCVTPASTRMALASGYAPVWHPSAGLDLGGLSDH